MGPHMDVPGQANRPLKINLDLLNYRAKTAQRKRNHTEAVRLWTECVEMDPYDGELRVTSS